MPQRREGKKEHKKGGIERISGRERKKKEEGRATRPSGFICFRPQ